MLLLILLRPAYAMASVAQILSHILNHNIFLQNRLLKYFPSHLAKQIWMNTSVFVGSVCFLIRTCFAPPYKSL